MTLKICVKNNYYLIVLLSIILKTNKENTSKNIVINRIYNLRLESKKI